MSDHSWIKDFPGAITVCDERGKILAMNEQAFETFADYGGRELVGRNVLDCHPEPARTKLDGMLRSGRPNVYTIRKKGKKKLVYQSPWFEAGRYGGFVEMVLVIPEDMPHFDRDARS